jgi:hypothetical protein
MGGMRQLIGGVLLTTVLIAAPAVAAAQHNAMGSARHEFGVDISASYVHQSLVGTSLNSFIIVTPVDVRLGFVSNGRLMFEPRFAFLFDSKATGTGSGYVFTPDVNVLYAKNHKRGMYVTAGAGVDLQKDVTATGSSAQFAVNGGIGTRSPYESGAVRLEAFVQYRFKNTSKGLPTTLSVGGRIGLSLWH